MTEQPDILSAWLYRLLATRWPVVAILTVVGLVAGAILALTNAPDYSSSALLRVGMIVHRGNLEPPRVLAARLETLVVESVGEDGCSARTSFVDPPESLVSLTVRCVEPKRAIEAAQAAVDAALKRHAELFDKALAETRAYLNCLDNTLDRLTEATVSPNDCIGDDVGLALWVVGELSADLRRATELEPGAYTFPTEILQPASAPVPSTPRRSVIALGGLCGLILGFLAAAFLQVIKTGSPGG